MAAPSAEGLPQDIAPDHYTVERELGRGGMATVYVARDTKHGRRVALKVLRPELAASLGAERFRREITLAASLQHPHIVPVSDLGQTSSGVCGSRCRSSRESRSGTAYGGSGSSPID